MNADLKGTLARVNKVYRLFEHNGKPMSKEQVEKVLIYGIEKGYTLLSEISNDEIDSIINEL